MLLKEYIPAAPLSPYIHCYWIVQCSHVMLPEKCIMDGYVKMFIYLNDNLPEYHTDHGIKKDWGDGFGGHQTCRDLFISTPGNLHLVFCLFKPLGFFQLFGVPIHHLNNTVAPLESFLGRRTSELKERLLSAAGDEHRITILNDFFLSLTYRLPTLRRTGMEYIQDRMHSRKGLIQIDDLSRVANLSSRTLERNFSEKIGMSPKYYARVLRFNYAFGLRRTNPQLGWFDIIHDCGYFDQTHFIKDFKHFTGQTPGTFYKASHPIKDIYLGRTLK